MSERLYYPAYDAYEGRVCPLNCSRDTNWVRGGGTNVDLQQQSAEGDTEQRDQRRNAEVGHG